LLLAGATVGAVGGVIAYQNKEGEVTNKVEKQYVATGAASALKIKTFSGKVHLKKGDVETVQIDYKDEEESPKIEFTFADGVLTMKEKERPWFSYVNFVWPWNFEKLAKDVTVITVPADSDIDYNLDVASGTIALEGLTTTKGFNLDCASGSIFIKDCTFGESIDIDATSGTTTLENVTAGGNLDIDGASGTINMSDITVGKTIDVDAISGSIIGKNIKCEKLKADCTSGKITLSKVDAEKSIDISAVSGSVNLSVVDAKENYSISVKKTSGSANIESRTDAAAPKSMSFNITSGNVSVTFDDNN
jgi:hypothetical protein